MIRKTARTNKLTPKIILSTTLILILTGTTMAFSVDRLSSPFRQYNNNRNSVLSSSSSNTNKRISSSPMSMYLDDTHAFDLTITSIQSTISTSFLPPASDVGGSSMQQLITTISSPAEHFVNVAQFAVVDPNIEAEVLNGMAHIALDLTSFISPAPAATCLFSVLGHIFAMASDYVPDHAISSKEILFQMFMLGISTHLFIKSSLSPLIASVNAQINHRDIRSYHALFSPSGLSIYQYKSLVGSGIIDFVHVQEGQIITSDESSSSLSNDNDIDDDNHLYWLYSGVAQIQSNGETIQTVTRKYNAPRLNDSNYIAMFGGMRFARRLDESRMNKSKNNRKSKKQKTTSSSLSSSKTIPSYKYPQTTIKAGGSSSSQQQASDEAGGALLLRINTRKLEALMDNDDQLAQCIRSMLLAEMQETLDSFVGLGSSNTTTKN